VLVRDSDFVMQTALSATASHDTGRQHRPSSLIIALVRIIRPVFSYSPLNNSVRHFAQHHVDDEQRCKVIDARDGRTLDRLAPSYARDALLDNAAAADDDDADRAATANVVNVAPLACYRVDIAAVAEQN
jgi:hypothetical protein